MSVTWPTPLPAPTLEGTRQRAADLLPGVDLKLRADVDGFSEVLVVKTREAAANPKLAKLRFALAGTGVSPSADAEGDLQAKDPQGRRVFVGPAPRMWDSSTVAASSDPKSLSAESSAADVEARADGPGESGRHVGMKTQVVNGALEVTPDQAMLTGPATEFPVFVDPGFSSARSTGR